MVCGHLGEGQCRCLKSQGLGVNTFGTFPWVGMVEGKAAVFYGEPAVAYSLVSDCPQIGRVEEAMWFGILEFWEKVPSSGLLAEFFPLSHLCSYLGS